MITRSLNFLLLIPLLILSACTTLVPNEYLVTHEQLDRAWDRSFPLHRELGKGVFGATLEPPKVRFISAQNRISLETRFFASSLFGGAVKGHLLLTGGLRYDAAQRALYLRDSNLETLQVDQGSPELGEMLRPMLNLMLVEYLRENPLYQFKSDELRYAGADIDITGIEVVDGGIRLKLKPR